MTLNAELDFPFDWSRWLAPVGDSIVGTPLVTVDSGLVLVSQSNTASVVIPFIRADAVGSYEVTCAIETATRKDSRTLVINVAPVR
jgi:hypothetical protein